MAATAMEAIYNNVDGVESNSDITDFESDSDVSYDLSFSTTSDESDDGRTAPDGANNPAQPQHAYRKSIRMRKGTGDVAPAVRASQPAGSQVLDDEDCGTNVMLMLSRGITAMNLDQCSLEQIQHIRAFLHRLLQQIEDRIKSLEAQSGSAPAKPRSPLPLAQIGNLPTDIKSQIASKIRSVPHIQIPPPPKSTPPPLDTGAKTVDAAEAMAKQLPLSQAMTTQLPPSTTSPENGFTLALAKPAPPPQSAMPNSTVAEKTRPASVGAIIASASPCPKDNHGPDVSTKSAPKQKPVVPPKPKPSDRRLRDITNASAPSHAASATKVPDQDSEKTALSPTELAERRFDAIGVPPLHPTAGHSDMTWSPLTEDFTILDSVVKSIVIDFPCEVPDLVEALLKGCEAAGCVISSPSACARVAYIWITNNIAYDCITLRSGFIRDQSPSATLASGKAVCDGYAQLFVAVVQALGRKLAFDIHVVKITGHYGAYPDMAPLRPKRTEELSAWDKKETNHAWNLIRIEGKFGLVECCHGAGYVNGDRFFQQPCLQGFLPDPRDLVCSHLPEDEDNQLLVSPVTKEVYKTFPELSYHAMQADFAPVDRLQRVMATDVNGHFIARFVQHRKYSTMVKMDGAPDNAALLQWEGDCLVLRVRCPAPGKYVLKIFSRDSSTRDSRSSLRASVRKKSLRQKSIRGAQSRHESSKYTQCLSFIVDATSMQPNPASAVKLFPVTCDLPTMQGGYGYPRILSPLTNGLEPDSHVAFEILASGVASVALVHSYPVGDGTNKSIWVYLSCAPGEGGMSLFHGSVRVRRGGKVDVCLQEAGRESKTHAVMARYDVLDQL